jgi:hypothetical protein
LKSIPLIKFNKLLWDEKSNKITNDKDGYETRDFKAVLSGE